jgi:hypothetical protein
MKEAIKTIIRNAYDLHIHIGPEIIPRKYTAQSLAEAERGNLAGAVLKNHFYPTAAMFDYKDTKGVELFGSIVLNNSVGGMNSEAVYAASLVSRRPLIVWFPTINSEQFLKSNKYEIAPEWVKEKDLKLKAAKDVKPVLVTKNGKLLPETKQVIEMIAVVKGVLATGHIAAAESMLVARYARSLHVPVIVTHPIYQHIDMTIAQQKALAAIGCYLEQPYSMYSMDGIAIAKIAQQIKAVGPVSVIMSSDVGQIFSLPPSQALAEFAELLIEEGIAIKDVETMLVKNPKKLLRQR